MTNINRRELLLAGAASLAALTAAAEADANTKTPPTPAPDQVNPNGRFTGKVVLITGATSGIGEGTAYAFAKEGAKVFFCGRRETLGKAVQDKIKGFGGEATYLRADVRKEDDVKAFVNGLGLTRLLPATNSVLRGKRVSRHEQRAFCSRTNCVRFADDGSPTE